MNYILFDGEERVNLLPFTYTRPIAGIRIGILTIAEKWEKYLESPVSYQTENYLAEKFPIHLSDDNLFINGSVCPDPELLSALKTLQPGETLTKGKVILGARLNQAAASTFRLENLANAINFQGTFQHIRFTWDIFSQNGQAIIADYNLLTAGRMSEPIPPSNRVIRPERIFIEPGAKVEFAILNASEGPIYIGRDAEIMEGCKVRGPFALGDHAGLKMDAKIYGPTTVGPYCKVGGEVNNSVFFAYSNKGHDGFIGNAVIGEWCNLGADTNNSNLKNTYEEVKLWSYRSERFEKTGLTFCGLMMGDHSKSGINTMFNTGTVVGVAANIFGSGFPRNFIPSFAWGGAQGFETFQIKKAFQVAEAMCARRNVTFGEMDKAILKEVYEQSKKFRYWEQAVNE